MSGMEKAMTVAVIAAATVLTRFLPFWLFPQGRRRPAWLTRLSESLPYAVIGLLVVYCLRGVDLTAPPYGLPEGIAVAAVAVLHAWRRNTLLSIGGGTLAYMLLVQTVF